MRLIAVLALLVPGLIGALERLILPSVELHHPVWTQRSETSARRLDHGAWNAFLSKYVSTDAAGVNRVAYAQVTEADRRALDAYLARLQESDPRKLNGPEQLAFWINLYNAATVDLVLEHYPVDSIRDITFDIFDIGPWSERFLRVLEHPLSLFDIEHRIIRAVWDEPRIHYALNCAAVGCPNLAKRAWRGATLESDLARAERAYVNDPRGVRLDADELVLSKVWFWFREDFGPDEAAVLERLRRIAEGRAAAALAGRREVDAYAYDWALNAAE